MNTIEEIKKAMKDKKLIVGQKSTVRMLKSKKTSLVVVSSNAPAAVKKELENLSRIAGAEFVDSEKNNLELGATCRKPFGVMVLSVKSGK
ncbi:MAG: ribosomal L7Ae/L30e/S12e/Gadd45 family protein [Nanoarchaeota archaeon]|nr:ribosomal L7Ae/L30e/S12e/Gadd45 family protein [Nanoarchaeota archaeon]